MTRYLDKDKFNIGVGGDQYRENWERIFRPKPESRCKFKTPLGQCYLEKEHADKIHRIDMLEANLKPAAKPSVLFDTPPEKWDEKTMAVALATCATAAEVVRKVGAKIGHVDLVFDGEFKVRLEWGHAT